jgi:hypothetical protein
MHFLYGFHHFYGYLRVEVTRVPPLLQVSHPFETAEFDIIYGEGINALGCILDAAEALKIVERRVSDSVLGHPGDCPLISRTGQDICHR